MLRSFAVRFVVAGADLMKMMKSKGFSFCLPKMPPPAVRWCRTVCVGETANSSLFGAKVRTTYEKWYACMCVRMMTPLIGVTS